MTDQFNRLLSKGYSHIYERNSGREDLLSSKEGVRGVWGTVERAAEASSGPGPQQAVGISGAALV